MRRNVSSSLNTTQKHNSPLVPARVPIPCTFGQVASMRNQLAPNGTAQLQLQRANARHRPTFQYTNRSTIPFTVVFQFRSLLIKFSSLQDKRVALPLPSSPTKAGAQSLHGQPTLRNQLTWLVLVTRIHTSQLPVAALGIRAVCFLLAAPSPAVGPRWTPCNVHIAVACKYCFRGWQVRSFVGVRSRYALVRSCVVPVSTRRTADATRCTQLERNERIHKAEKNTMQGAFTLLSYPM